MRGLDRTDGTGGRARRRLLRRAVSALVAGVVVLGVACGDGEGLTEPPIDLDEVQGLYEPVTLTFDPQGSAPAGDILAALAESGLEPSLNISRTGTFQVPYRDPVTGEFRTLEGTVQPVGQTLTMTFNTAAAANQLLLPRTFSLGWDADDETLSLHTTASVSRVRLQELFPDLYGQEPWAGETIPGFLSVEFVRGTAISGQ